MPVDTSLYGAFGARPKTIGEYEAELDAAELRKQGIQQNALALRTGQLGIEDRQRALQDQSAIRNALVGLGANATDEARIGALRGTGLPMGFAQADALEKTMAERQKTQASVNKDRAAAEETTLKTALAKQSHIAQLAGTAVDQASWTRALELASYIGADVSKIPQQFDPNVARQLAQTALTSQQQLEARLKMLTEARQTANEFMIPDGKGGFMVNQPLVDAKSRVAQSGASSITMGSPVPVQLPDGTTGLVQPGNRPGVAPQVLRLTPDGKPLAPAKDPNAEKPLTETQGNATTFAARMKDASRVIESMESKGVSGSDVKTMAAGNSYTNFLASPEGQQYRQAQENWVTANLRKESGAAIPKDEMDKDIAKWFPKIGDRPEVRAQKAQARKVAEQGMLVQAGPGAKQVDKILESTKPTAKPSGDPVADALKKYGG